MNRSTSDARIIRDHGMFRLILTAMSHPGSVLALPELDGEPEALSLFLSPLMDQETTFAVIGDRLLSERLQRSTFARPVDVDEADYIIAAQASTEGMMSRFRRGTLEYPDRSATLVYRVESLGHGDLSLTLSGPGVDGQTELEIGGMDMDEFRQLQGANMDFPLGLDALFLDRAGRIAAIARSTRTEGV